MIIRVCWGVLGVLLSVYLASALHLRSDLSFFLADEQAQADRFLLRQLQQGDANRVLVMALAAESTNESAHSDKLAQLSKTLTRAFQASGYFSAVNNGAYDITAFNALYPYRYLLSPMLDKQDRFTQAALKQDFARVLQHLQILLTPQQQQHLAADPQNTWIQWFKQWRQPALQRQYGVWFDQQQRAILLLKTQAPGFDLAQQQILVDYLHETVQAQTQGFAVAPVITGAPIFALAAREAIRHQIQVLSVIASALLLVFLYAIFRSCASIGLIMLPMGFAILVGMAVVNALYGYVHGITLAFGITLLGVAVDYPIHLLAHRQRAQSPVQTLHHIWPSLRLGLATTIIGFFAITFSDFSGLSQLGVFAISGLITAACVTYTVLPTFSSQPVHRRFTLSMQNRCCYRRLAGGLMLGSCLWLGWQGGSLWEDDLSALSPVPAAQKRSDFALRQAMNVPELRFMLVTQGDSSEQVLQQAEALAPILDQWQAQGVISGYDSAAHYLPSVQRQQHRQQRLPEADELQQQLNLALIDSPLKASVFTPFRTAIARSQYLTARTLENVGAPLLGQVQRLLYAESAHWVGILPLMGVVPEKLQAQAWPAANTELVDLKQRSQQVLRDYRMQALSWFALGTGLIVGVLMLFSPNRVRLLGLVLPFSGAVLLTMSSLTLLGFTLSIFHLVTLLLVVGLSIDYSVFLQAVGAGDDAEQVGMTLNAVGICSVSTLIMFGALAFSSLPVLQAIGLTASLGTIFALGLSLMFNRPCA